MTTLRQSASGSESHKSISSQVNISYSIANLPAKFRNRIAFQPCENKSVIGDCWAFNGRSHGGYRKAYYKGLHGHAHRVIYQLLRGPIPAGMHVDHLCYNRACVNPAHLEAVTPAENLRRSHVTGTGNGARTHCRQGHEFTPSNIYRWRGKRFCLKCQSIRQEAYEKRKAEKGRAA